MPTNFTSFRIGLKKEVELTREQANLFKRRLALEILRGVVMRTPVDTGRARGNWQVAIGAPINAAKAGKDKNGVRTIVAGTNTIERAQFGQTIYLSNNLPYIGALEDGHSGRAPAGMVKLTLESVARRFARVKEVPR